MDESNEKAFTTNEKIFSEGVDLVHVKEYYNAWETYDEDLHSHIYGGPLYAAQAVARWLPDQYSAKIADIGAGTGKVGKELRRLGYTNVIGVEGASDRIEQAKNIYQSIIPCYIGPESRQNIQNDEFSCAVSSGVFGPNHMKLSGIDELIRIVKPGGIIVTAMREEFFNNSYNGKLQSYFTDLDENGCIETLEKRIVEKFFCNKTGIVLIHKVLVTGYKNRSVKS